MLEICTHPLTETLFVAQREVTADSAGFVRLGVVVALFCTLRGQGALLTSCPKIVVTAIRRGRGHSRVVSLLPLRRTS